MSSAYKKVIGNRLRVTDFTMDQWPRSTPWTSFGNVLQVQLVRSVLQTCRLNLSLFFKNLIFNENLFPKSKFFCAKPYKLRLRFCRIAFLSKLLHS